MCKENKIFEYLWNGFNPSIYIDGELLLTLCKFLCDMNCNPGITLDRSILSEAQLQFIIDFLTSKTTHYVWLALEDLSMQQEFKRIICDASKIEMI